MSRRRAILPKAELRRRIDVLKEAGIPISSIQADGTIIIGTIPPQSSGRSPEDEAFDKWIANAKG